MDKDELHRFKVYLEDNGAVLKPSTNPFELVRFELMNGGNRWRPHIIYINKHGHITSFSSADADTAYTNFRGGKPFKAVDRKRQQVTARKSMLATRDGKECWFCGIAKEKDELTVEHLLAVSLGGSDNINNLVLACEPCNVAVGNWSVAKKVLFREEKRGLVVGNGGNALPIAEMPKGTRRAIPVRDIST